MIYLFYAKMIIQQIYNKTAFLIGKIRVVFRKKFFHKIGKSCFIMKNCLFYSPGWITLWDRVFVNINCIFDGKWWLKIWDDVSFWPNVRIWTFNHNFEDRNIPINVQWNILKNVSIGNDVRIGDGSIILPWVTIGNGSIIAAWSVVTKNVGEFEIWGGNPARFIKYR